MDTFFTRHTFGVLLSTVIVIVAGLVCIAWRIKKVEDPGEILYWKGIWVFVFSLLVVVGFYWFIAYGLGRMGAH